MKNQFRKKFIRKFGKDYNRVVRELRKDAEWEHPFFYGSAQFLQIAEGLKKAVEAQDVLDKLGEPYAITQSFLRQTGRDVPEFKRWARTSSFVKEWYGDWEEERRVVHSGVLRKTRRRKLVAKRIGTLKKEALQFGRKP